MPRSCEKLAKIRKLALRKRFFRAPSPIAIKMSESVRSKYMYDPNGNRLSATSPAGSMSGTYDNQDRLLTYGDKLYSYNANGELVSRTNLSSNQSDTYQFDALGNLKRVTLPDHTEVQYLLDGMNRRVAKKVNGAFVQGFLYKTELAPIAELDTIGHMKTKFIYGSSPYSPDYLVRANAKYRLVKDHLGSPKFVIDTATSEIMQRMDYDEFGNVILDTNPGFQPFGFAGGIYDRDTKLTHFGAREYDAATGRWLSKDPIGFGGGDSNLYRYVMNGPLNAIDPSGLEEGGFPGGSSILFGGIDENFPSIVNTVADAGATVAAAGAVVAGGAEAAPAIAIFCASNPTVCNQIIPTAVSNIIGGVNDASLTPNGNTEPDLAALGIVIKQLTRRACGK
jgi:RHS repeat-associated protein